MRIQKLTVREFRCFKQIDVDLSSDVIAIYGRNGIGKTSLFDAIEFALFGSVGRLEDFGDTVDYITRVGAETAPMASLSLLDNSTTRQVETSWNRESHTVRAIGGSRSWPSHRELLYEVLVDKDSLGSRHEVAAVR